MRPKFCVCAVVRSNCIVLLCQLKEFLPLLLQAFGRETKLYDRGAVKTSFVAGKPREFALHTCGRKWVSLHMCFRSSLVVASNELIS